MQPRHIILIFFAAALCAVTAGWVMVRHSDAGAQADIWQEAQMVEQRRDVSLPVLAPGQDVFLRIIKSTDGAKKDGRLEAFIENDKGVFEFVKDWDICAWSGQLGPKLREGDRQSPEGFYQVTPAAMNPNSSYHLSFNLGFPNAFDRSLGRTGSFLMVHGNCVSIGCYAMTDPGIEEIYDLVSRAFSNGQETVPVHIFPFEMSDENLQAYLENTNYPFWQNLKTGWDLFERHKVPPKEYVLDGKYAFESEL